MDIEERFWAKVDRSGDCWLWRAYRDPRGYGRFNWRSGKPVGAHRIAYELIVGPIPAGLEIDHLCFVPACVNPAHLEAVTPQVNRERRRLGVICRQGHLYAEVGRTGTGFCRECRRRVNRVHERKPHRKAYQVAWRAQTAPTRNEGRRERYANNHEAMLARQRAYKAAHRAQYNAYERARRARLNAAVEAGESMRNGQH